MTIEQQDKIQNLLDRNITTLQYHRKPTPAEVRFGYGAIHHADIDVTLCVNKDGQIKKRLKLDGLWYSR